MTTKGPLEPSGQEYMLGEERKGWGAAEWANEASWADSDIRRLIGDWINTDPGSPDYEETFGKIAQAVARAAFARGKRQQLEKQGEETAH